MADPEWAATPRPTQVRQSTGQRPARADAVADPCPLLRCSPATLRILIIWLALHEREALAAAVAPTARAAASSLCEFALCLTATALLDRELPGALHRLLERRLDATAARFRGQCLYALADLWSRENETLHGRELVALLWIVATHPCPLFGRLEAAIVRRIDAGQRWSLLDRSEDPFGV